MGVETEVEVRALPALPLLPSFGSHFSRDRTAGLKATCWNTYRPEVPKYTFKAPHHAPATCRRQECESSRHLVIHAWAFISKPEFIKKLLIFSEGDITIVKRRNCLGAGYGSPDKVRRRATIRPSVRSHGQMQRAPHLQNVLVNKWHQSARRSTWETTIVKPKPR